MRKTEAIPQTRGKSRPAAMTLQWQVHQEPLDHQEAGRGHLIVFQHLLEIEDRLADDVLQKRVFIHVERAKFEILPDPQDHPDRDSQPGQVRA